MCGQDLAQLLFELESNTGSSDNKEKIIELLKADDMAPMYQSLCEKHGWDIDDSLLNTMMEKNKTALTAIDEQEAEASSTGGDMEIIDAVQSRARYYARIGDFSKAIGLYDDLLSRPKAVASKRLDSLIEKCRIALFCADSAKLKVLLAETKKAVDAGGDWDRRNRLKVYEALTLLLQRDLRGAAQLLSDCIATFTCVELCSYDQFMFYTVVVAIPSFTRPQLQKMLINNPQVIAALRDHPTLRNFLHSLYDCDYAAFFRSMLELQEDIQVFILCLQTRDFSSVFQKNRFLGPHSNFLFRELRILAYSQFLGAYKSVKMSSMANAFGMSVDLLDIELSRFIATGKVNAKVDKVGDVVVTNRPDMKNAQYQNTIKKGDQLLNQIQRLVRVLDV